MLGSYVECVRSRIRDEGPGANKEDASNLGGEIQCVKESRGHKNTSTRTVCKNIGNRDNMSNKRQTVTSTS